MSPTANGATSAPFAKTRQKFSDALLPESALLRIRMGGSDYTYARSACGIPPDGTVGLEYFPNLLLRLVARHYSYHAIHEIHNDHMPPDPLGALRPRWVVASPTEATRPALTTTRAATTPLKVVRKVYTGLQSFRSIRRIDASCRNAKRIAAEVLEVLGEATAAIEPCQGALDNPAHRQDNEAAGVIGTLHDLDR